MRITDEKISEMVERYSDTVFKLAFSYTKNRYDAEDVVQEVFLRLVRRSGGDFQSTEHIRAWLLRVTVNVCKDKLKEYWNRNIQGLSNADEIFADDKYSHENTVFQAVMSLDELQRTVIHLYYYEGYTAGDIAKMLEKRESSVRSILHRARKSLKRILKEEYDFE